MSVSVRLAGNQMEHVRKVLRKAKIAVETDGNVLSMTGDNYYQIVAALEAAHMASVRVKTKSFEHMERIYLFQQIIPFLKTQSTYFPKSENN